MLIRISDIRRVFCVDGARQLADRHGLDFRAFIRNGMDDAELRGLIPGDEGLLDRVIEAKREAENGR